MSNVSGLLLFSCHMITMAFVFRAILRISVLEIDIKPFANVHTCSNGIKTTWWIYRQRAGNGAA